MNSDLAFNLNGEPFDVPANATGWRVRRMKSKGAPEVVFGRNGVPLVLPIEADLDDLRAETAAPGRYRLDPVDDTNRPIANTSAGYVYVHEPARTEPVAPVRPGTQTPVEAVVLEALRMVQATATEAMRMTQESASKSAEIARCVIEAFPQVVEANADLLRAADGAGLPQREPRATDDDEEDDQEDDVPHAPPTSSALEMLNSAIAFAAPLFVDKFMNGKGINLGSVLDWRKASANGHEARKPETRDPTTHVTAAAAQTEPVKASASTLPAIDPPTMTHFLAIQSALTPAEATTVRTMAAELSAEDRIAWMNELSAMAVPAAVARIRAFLDQQAAATSETKGGAS